MSGFAGSEQWSNPDEAGERFVPDVGDYCQMAADLEPEPPLSPEALEQMMEFHFGHLEEEVPDPFAEETS
jgi:hypothetical protein